MIALYILSGFFVTIVSILIGYMFGYQAGYKSEKTLKQQISKLKSTIKRQNESKQLRELTTAELKGREDWDFRSKMAELMGQPVTTGDTIVNDDPASIERTF